MDIRQAYQQIAGFDTPNPMQQQVWEKVYDNQWGVGLLLKGPTGSGKTEAVSIPALVKEKQRLIMVYPTRSLVEDQIGRFRRMLSSLSQHIGAKPFTLIIDTGSVSERHTWKHGQEIKATGNLRRHLYQGDVIITTLDKFLYRFFGFGEPGKSYIYPLRIHYTNKQTLLCFDEAHAYDDVAFTNFDRLVKTLYQKGLDLVLMTATMPAAFEETFDYLDRIDFMQEEEQQALVEFTSRQFPGHIYPNKHLTYFPTVVGKDIGADLYYSDETEPLDTISPAIEKIIELTQEKYHHDPKKRLIVTIERVKDAAAVYKTLANTLSQAEVLLYHGRLTAGRRKSVYERVLTLEKQNKGYVLISTSAIEVGCDLDAHILITQLCDPERLIQRVGRCNRKQRIFDAEIIVVGDTVPEWLTSLTETGLAKYTAELKRQNGQPLDVKPLINCIEKQPNPDYRIEMMFDMLYEYVYEARLENKSLHEKALLFTRSWEPTITLCTGEDKGRLINAVEVSMSRCVAKKDEPIAADWWLRKYTFNRQDRKPEWDNVGRWECAYAIDLVATPGSLYDFDEETGYVNLPKLFNYSYRSSYRRVLVREDGGDKNQFWYLDRLSGDVKLMLTEQASSTDEDDTSEANE